MLLKSRDFGVLRIHEHRLLFSLELLVNLEILEEVLVPLKDSREYGFLPLAPRQHAGARVPADRVLALWIDAALERDGTRGLRPPLQAELVGPVAKHDSLEAPDGSLGHLSLASIAGDARTRVVDSVRHF